MPASKKKSSPDELLRAHVDQLAQAVGVQLVDPVEQAHEAEEAAKAAEAEDEDA